MDNEATKWALQTIAPAHACIPSILGVSPSISNKGGGAEHAEKGMCFMENMVLIVPTFN